MQTNMNNQVLLKVEYKGATNTKGSRIIITNLTSKGKVINPYQYQWNLEEQVLYGAVKMLRISHRYLEITYIGEDTKFTYYTATPLTEPKEVK